MLELDEVLRIAGRLEAMADEGKVRISPMEARALAFDLRAVARDCEPRRTCKNVADPYDGSYFECSRCGEKWELTCGSPADNHLNYCPDCGAKVES